MTDRKTAEIRPTGPSWYKGGPLALVIVLAALCSPLPIPDQRLDAPANQCDTLTGNSSRTVQTCSSHAILVSCCSATNQTGHATWSFRRAVHDRWTNPPSPRFLLYRHNRTIIQFKRPLSIHAGQYRCTVEDPTGIHHDSIINFKVEACPESWKAPPGLAEPEPGTEVYASAHAQKSVSCCGNFGDSKNRMNRELVNVSWTKTDQDGYTAVGYQELRKDATTVCAVLSFHDVTPEDYGVYTCFLQNKWGVTNTSILLRPPEHIADPALKVAVSVVCVVVVFVILVVSVTYYLRLDILLLYKDRCRRTPFEAGAVYDALVVYNEKSDQDSEFVTGPCRQELEERHNYKLCLSSRDFVIGELVLRNYKKSLSSSRCVLVVVSPDFMSDAYCRYMTKQVLAREQRHIVFLILRPLAAAADTSEDDRLIEGAVRVGCKVEWPKKESKRIVETFWKRLRYNLPTPVAEAQRVYAVDVGHYKDLDPD